jgi:hypothetical protein
MGGRLLAIGCASRCSTARKFIAARNILAWLRNKKDVECQDIFSNIKIWNDFKPRQSNLRFGVELRRFGKSLEYSANQTDFARRRGSIRSIADASARMRGRRRIMSRESRDFLRYSSKRIIPPVFPRTRQLRQMLQDGKGFLAELEKRERERTASKACASV